MEKKLILFQTFRFGCNFSSVCFFFFPFNLFFRFLSCRLAQRVHFFPRIKLAPSPFLIFMMKIYGHSAFRQKTICVSAEHRSCSGRNKILKRVLLRRSRSISSCGDNAHITARQKRPLKCFDFRRDFIFSWTNVLRTKMRRLHRANMVGLVNPKLSGVIP